MFKFLLKFFFSFLHFEIFTSFIFCLHTLPYNLVERVVQFSVMSPFVIWSCISLNCYLDKPLDWIVCQSMGAKRKRKPNLLSKEEDDVKVEQSNIPGAFTQADKPLACPGKSRSAQTRSTEGICKRTKLWCRARLDRKAETISEARGMKIVWLERGMKH